MGKISGSGSGMNNPDHISESLETISWVQILKFFDADPGFGMEIIRIWEPGSGMEKIRIRDRGWKKFGSRINIQDPQHWKALSLMAYILFKIRWIYAVNGIHRRLRQKQQQKIPR
jgi:hypothetical protein